MRTSVRSLLGVLSLFLGAVTMAACAGTIEGVTRPLTDCPAASLSLGTSRSLAPSGVSATTNGCAHRAPIEVPLAQVIDLNDNAEVLGIRINAGNPELVVWSKAGFRPLPAPPGATSVTGVDLNDNGEAVGCATYPSAIGSPATPSSRHSSSLASPSDVCHVVRWSALGVPTDLGTLDPAAQEARAFAINNAGAIVGTLVYPDGQRAFIRSASGALTLIPTPGTRSAAVALNEQGDVTGWFTNGAAAFGPWHGFIWSQAGGTVIIPDLAAGATDAEASMKPAAISESGEVLGTLYAYHPSTPTALDRRSTFLYSRGAGTRDIGAASGFTQAVSLNDQGEILGFATLDATLQPVSWAITRPSQLAVRYGWQPGEGAGSLYTINNWNEVLDSYTQGGVLHNVVWTWNPERYR